MITDEQVRALSAELPRDMVDTRKQAGQTLSYVTAWRLIDLANRVFGFDGWASRLGEVRIVRESVVERTGRNDDGTSYAKRSYVAVVQASMSVSALGIQHDDVGVGIGDASEANAAQALELALKAAATDALKRALRCFGMPFGLALYDREQEFVGASSGAQSLLADAKSLPAAQLAGWALQNAAAIHALHVDDRALVNACIAARQAEAVVIEMHDRIARAATEAELRAVLADAQARGVDHATLHALVQRCSARKAQLAAAVAVAATPAPIAAPAAAPAPAPSDPWGLSPPTVTVAAAPAATASPDAAPWLARISAAQSVGEIAAVLRDAQVAAVPSTVIQALVPKATERKLQLQNGARAA